MAKIIVRNQTIKTLTKDGVDYICITDIARQLNNPNFKGVEFDPLLKEAGSNAFTMSPTRWVELPHAVVLLNFINYE